MVKLCTTCPKENEKKRKNPPELGTTCERYWLLNLAPTFEQHMEPPLKTSYANLTKDPTCLEYEDVILTYMLVGTTLRQ